MGAAAKRCSTLLKPFVRATPSAADPAKRLIHPTQVSSRDSSNDMLDGEQFNGEGRRAETFI